MALTDKLTAIANAIRAKTGKTATMTLSEMVTEIEGISGGGDTSAEDGIIDRTISGEYTNNRVTSVGAQTFRSCSKLTTVDFPNATSIGTYAFYGCSALTSADFPKVTGVASSAFSNCSKLTSVNLPAATSIAASAFSSCTALTSLELPKVTSIGNSVFQSSSLVSVSLPLVTSISTNLFYRCESLERVEAPAATSINSNAFYNCELGTLDFPAVKSISAYAFRNSSLATLILRSTAQVCSLANTNAFDGTAIGDGLGYIYVPDSLIESYIAATNWSTYATRFLPLSEYTGG